MQEWSQKQVNEIDSAIDDARVKATDATATKKTDFDHAMLDVKAKRDVVRAELATLETQSALALSDFETRIHTHLDELQTRVDTMRNAL